MKLNYFSQILHPESYHSNKSSSYFEGWYYKLENKTDVISFIPGVSFTKNGKHAFIQIISTLFDRTLNLSFPIEDFNYSIKPFSISIGKNYFGLDEIRINVTEGNYNIEGHLRFYNITPLSKNILSPSIMGPFSYIPNMECNHEVLSLHHYLLGYIKINNRKINFDYGLGYIEKDWGTSFPKRYVWTQCNNFIYSPRASVMASIAHIPMLNGHYCFTGFLAVAYCKDKEYRFTTYNGSKVKLNKKNNIMQFIITRGKSYLEINTTIKDIRCEGKLNAPKKGSMTRNIFECISTDMNARLIIDNNVIFNDIGKNASLEIV